VTVVAALRAAALFRRVAAFDISYSIDENRHQLSGFAALKRNADVSARQLGAV
jgi:hypothetical protein